MDKNMIHIDNLVQQRLGGGEEQERPGAWLRMRDLLDENMPVQKPVAFPWRRMMSYMAAILAISAAGIGGFKILSGLHDSAKPAKVAAVANTAEKANTQPAAVTNTNATATSGSAVNGRGNILTTNDKDRYSNAEGNAPAKNKQAVKKAVIKAVANKPASADNGAKSGDNASAPVAENTAKESNGASNKKLNNNNLTNNISTAAVGNKAAKKNHTQPAAIVPAASLGNAVAANNKPVHGKGNTEGGKHGKGSKDNKVADNNKASQQPAISKPAVDSIPAVTMTEKMTVDHRTNKATFTQDVTGRGKAALPEPMQRPANSVATAENNYLNPRYVASAASGQVAEVKPAPVMPAAAAETKASAEDKNIGLGKNRNSRRSHQGWNFDAVNQFFKDVKYNLGQIEYSSGIVGGVNAMFLTGKTMPGIQLGFSETFGISDNVSIVTELRYMQGIGGTTLHDNYTRYNTEIDGTYSKDSMEHNYKFNTLTSLSLPVAVRYTIGRVKILAGVSFSYIIGITPEVVDNAIPTTHQALATKPAQSEIDAHYYKIGTDAFASRFGIGGLVGVSYNVAPRIDVDIRITKNFWDDAKLPGAKIVSDRLYKRPGLQLNFNYNLSKEKKH
ncbi:MAG: outer membrane beta-barrel protein [Bacteroidetes bacterium]|nr:outer membrane beta-barrel protein [Bacteroidota bacterium]